MARCWLLPVVFGAAFISQAATPPSLRISAESAPAGGWAQIKIYAAKPVAIASGHLVLNLDATAFGPGAMVGLFGANGDAAGLATVMGSQIDVQFSSPTGGIGQLAGLPVMVVSIPVLKSAAGRTVAITATSPDSSVSVAGGSVTVQGTLSVQKIPAGMGVVAAGTVAPIYGAGFTPSTTVTIDGVEIAAERFISPGEIDVTIGGAAELVGKLARVTDSGVEFDYFCFQPNSPVNFPETTYFGSVVANVQPLFPLLALTGFTWYLGYVGGVVEVQNPNATAATVNFTSTHNCCGPTVNGFQETLSIPAGSWTIVDNPSDSSFVGSADLPVRVIPMTFCSFGVALPVCLSTPNPYDASTRGPAAPGLAPWSLAFAWQVGSSTLPAARTVLASYPGGEIAVTATPASGQSWLSVSSTAGGSTGGTFSVSVNPSQLTVGNYQGSILFRQGYGPAATLQVSLTVTSAAVPTISASPASLSFTATTFTSTPYSQTIGLTSDSGPAPFSVTLQPGTWLMVTPMSGTTPATLTVTWDPTVTSQIYYPQRSTPASILISGPGNAITVPAAFNVTGVQTFQSYLGASGTGPNGLAFSAQTGTSSQTQTINVDPPGVISPTADQPWMSVAAPTASTVVVTANPAGLGAGVYRGTVTIGEPGLTSMAVPVVFGVWSSAPPLTITSGSFTFVQTVGEPAPAYQTAEVDSGGVPVPLTIAIGGSWLWVFDRYSAPTPAPILVGLVNPPTAPGQYDGSFTIRSPGGLVYAPVTLLVEPGPVAPPVVSQVVNAASGIAGGVSPGEIVSIRGYSVGASAVSGLTLDESGVVSNLNGLQVTFDGKAAPLISTSAYQTNVVVPYQVAGKRSTAMQVVYAASSGTVRTAAWVLPVVASAPGVFTVDATGTGQGAVANQDGSVNSAANPAARGSIVTIYATGQGPISPAGVTGSVTQFKTKARVLPVTVTIGGMGAAVRYAGSAPGEIAGLLQVNAVIPQGVGPGSAVPVTLKIGENASQAGVTMAVK